MGQVALGLRSLAVRAAIFLVMAAMLAWVLGGTLFPSPQRVNLPAWEFDGAAWNWRVTGSSTTAGPAEWTLFEQPGTGAAVERRFEIQGLWREIWGPQIEGSVMVLGIESEEERAGSQLRRWWLVRVNPASSRGFDATILESRAALIEHFSWSFQAP